MSLFIIHTQNQGVAMSQGISSRSIDLVVLEYSDFSLHKV